MFTSLVEKPTLAEDERIEVVRPAIRIDLFG
jgi:hypothetical protein